MYISVHECGWVGVEGVIMNLPFHHSWMPAPESLYQICHKSCSTLADMEAKRLGETQSPSAWAETKAHSFHC